ncbi:accessory Sec-dependent serine-rich glycoprotein adhesin, partial [Streptococcus sp. oral taxon 431]|uniref:accessory Sec-dependent serine-rich glycoprotein adhesin n=1 Tax=Streptococcus sp. oral taxon 431 TaxID=712633 RepID=UPI003565CC83
MFFRRQEGRYRETDRVTRYKLIKSGKHWLRASTSLFGLFKVLRGGIDTTQVTTEVVEDRVSTSITGLDILKGIAAAGTIVGGGIVTQSHVYANEQTAVEKTIEGTDTLVTSDQAVLGTVNKDSEQQASVSASTSISESASTSASTSAVASASASTSAVASASASTSAVASASASTSTSLAASASSTVSNSQTATVDSTQVVSQEETVESTEAKPVSQAETLSPTLDGKVSLGNSISRVETINSMQADVATTATTAIAATVTTEATAKKTEEDRKKLAKLSAEMGEYLAKAADLPDASSAITKVSSAILEIEKALANSTSDLTAVVNKATLARDSIAAVVSQSISNQNLKEGDTTSQDVATPSKVLLDQNLSEAEILATLATNYSSKVGNLEKKASLDAAIAKIQSEISNSDRLLKAKATEAQYVQQREQLGSAVDELMSALTAAGFSGNTTVNGSPAISANLNIAVGQTKVYLGEGKDPNYNIPIYYKLTVTNDGSKMTFVYTVTYDNPTTSTVEYPSLDMNYAIYNTRTSNGSMFTLGSGFGTPSNVKNYITDSSGKKVRDYNTSTMTQEGNGYSWGDGAQMNGFMANKGYGLTSSWTVPIKSTGETSFTFSPVAREITDSTGTNFFNVIVEREDDTNQSASASASTSAVASASASTSAVASASASTSAVVSASASTSAVASASASTSAVASASASTSAVASASASTSAVASASASTSAVASASASTSAVASASASTSAVASASASTSAVASASASTSAVASTSASTSAVASASASTSAVASASASTSAVASASASTSAVASASASTSAVASASAS